MEHNYITPGIDFAKLSLPRSLLARKIETACHTPVLEIVQEPPVLTPIGERLKFLLTQGKNVCFKHVYVEPVNIEQQEALHDLGHAWVTAMMKSSSE